MSVRTKYEKGYSASNPIFASLLTYDYAYTFDRSKKGIIALHGHGGSALQYIGGGAIRKHPAALAKAGYVVLAVDLGSTSWSSDAALAAVTDAHTWLANKVADGKIGIMGYSMGGLTSLNWIKQNSEKVAAVWLWNPLLDLDWAHSTVGYVPPEGGSVANVSGWVTEIDAAYSGNFATNSVGHKVMNEPITYRLGIPIKVCSAVDDTTIPISHGRYFVGQVNDPLVTQRLPEPTGGHGNTSINVPTQEVVDFYKAYL